MWHCAYMATRKMLHPEINRTALAAKIEVDRGLLTNILNGNRKAPVSIALAVFRETGIQLGVLAGKSKRDIAVIEKALELTSAA